MKKSIVKFLFIILFIPVAFLLLGEVLYRTQLFDFYASEFKYLNPQMGNTYDSTVLVIGDSYSTYPNGYVDQLRTKSPQVNYINAAIPGTGIRQHRLIIKKRLRDYQPNRLLYQFYIGNDFIDIKHPTNSNGLSWFRKFYWNVSERLLFVPYLNYKLAIFKAKKQSIEMLQKGTYSPENYNNRVKLNFKGNPNYLAESLELKGEAEKAYQVWKKNFEEILNELPPKTRVSILFVPHCAQVSLNYARRMAELGANLNENALKLKSDYYMRIKEDFPRVDLIDPQEYFQNVEQSGRQLYFNNDPHLNKLGQYVIAKYLYIRGL